MKIIGEKINGAIPKTGEAIKSRNVEYILELVREQDKAGADYIDVSAGTSPEEEYDALCWLLDIVQSVTEKPLCIDSPNPRIIEKVFPKAVRPGLLNSISLEGDKCEVLLPILQSNPDWQIVALCCKDGAIAEKAEDKTKIALDLLSVCSRYGVEPNRVHIDPLVLALSAVNDAAIEFCEATRSIKAAVPSVNIAAALSNISYGIPARSLMNGAFLTMAMLAGLDTLIIDPLDRNIIGHIMATNALMNKDKYCGKYSRAFRQGRIGPNNRR